jgi:hypothetical protein
MEAKEATQQMTFWKDSKNKSSCMTGLEKRLNHCVSLVFATSRSRAAAQFATDDCFFRGEPRGASPRRFHFQTNVRKCKYKNEKPQGRPILQISPAKSEKF